MDTNQRKLRCLGLIAALGVLIVGIGETLMHWTGTVGAGGEDAGTFDFLLGISHPRLIVGHFMCVLAAPAYFLGYWVVAQRLHPARKASGQWFFAGSA